MGKDVAGKRRISLDLSDEMVRWLDGLKPEYGQRSRGALVEQLLSVLREAGDDDTEEGFDAIDTSTSNTADDDSAAIVLIHSELVSQRVPQPDPADSHESNCSAESFPAQRAGIQLPGFVRRQAREWRRSLAVEPRSTGADQALALISEADLNAALERVDLHWIEVYGHGPNEAVLEAAMIWLARDVWPQSDHSDGRPFSWSLAQQVVLSFAPSWPLAEANLARAITMAGVLEDPFSGGTLAIRIPTLITRFVQRHRSRQKRTTSFEAIDQSMSVHSALRLLQLPTVADRPYSFQEIRDAYREQAQSHHPDAGGSAEAMRRLNEAYQFLKERYRRAA